MHDRIVLVTGGNSGVGKAAAVALAAMGARVTIAARNEVKGELARDEIRACSRSEHVGLIALDLASFDSVRTCAKEFATTHDRLDVLINNAGVVLRKRAESTDGHEMQFQVNHLGHFLLTDQLRPLLEVSGYARVVATCSDAHRYARSGLRFDDLEWTQRRYRAFGVYAGTKLMNLLFTRELARRLDGTGITANAVHPGFVASNFAREGDGGWLGSIAMAIGRPFARSPQNGARTTVHVASAPALSSVTGQYFANERLAQPSRAAQDDTAARRLWEVSAALTA
ncbi:MAG: SDR family oxidoreductase [Actinomycetota bacterium]